MLQAKCPADTTPDVAISAYERASIGTHFYRAAQAELSMQVESPIGLPPSGHSLLKQAADSTGIKAALSGGYLFSVGGLIGKADAVPTLAVHLDDATVHALPSHPGHSRSATDRLPLIHHTLTGLDGAPHALVIGGVLVSTDGSHIPAPPCMLQLAGGGKSTSLTCTPLACCPALPRLSQHSACATSPCSVLLFGGQLEGALSAEAHLLSQDNDDHWAHTALTMVSQHFDTRLFRFPWPIQSRLGHHVLT